MFFKFDSPVGRAAVFAGALVLLASAVSALEHDIVFCQLPVEHVVLVQGDHPQPPAGRAEVLGVGIDQDGVVGTEGEH